MTTVLSVQKMAQIIPRCESVICGKAPERFASVYMLAVRKTPVSKLCLQILISPNVHGERMMVSSLTDKPRISLLRVLGFLVDAKSGRKQ